MNYLAKNRAFTTFVLGLCLTVLVNGLILSCERSRSDGIMRPKQGSKTNTRSFWPLWFKSLNYWKQMPSQKENLVITSPQSGELDGCEQPQGLPFLPI